MYCIILYTCTCVLYCNVLMRDERRKEERSKQDQTNNKAKQHSTPKAVTFPKKNELPQVHVYTCILMRDEEGRKYMYIHSKQGQCACIYMYISLSSIQLSPCFFQSHFPRPSLPLSLPPPLPPSPPPSLAPSLPPPPLPPSPPPSLPPPDTRCYLAGGRVLSLGESAVVLTVPPSNQTRAADVILIVDESSSMTVEHAWIPDMIQQLDTALMVRELHACTCMLYYNNYSMYKCMYVQMYMYSAPPKMLGAGQWQYCSFLLYIHVYMYMYVLYMCMYMYMYA